MSERDVNKEYKISDEMWKQMEPLLPPEIPTSSDGRPRMDDQRAMEGILDLDPDEIRDELRKLSKKKRDSIAKEARKAKEHLLKMIKMS